MGDGGKIEALSAVTIGTRDMARAVQFYENLGFRLCAGGPQAEFTSFRAGPNFLNLAHVDAGILPAAGSGNGWGRLVFHVEDVDALYRHAVACGFQPAAPPRDAEWGERFFHLTDPDGHELSFARPLPAASRSRTRGAEGET